MAGTSYSGPLSGTRVPPPCLQRQGPSSFCLPLRPGQSTSSNDEIISLFCRQHYTCLLLELLNYRCTRI